MHRRPAPDGARRAAGGAGEPGRGCRPPGEGERLRAPRPTGLAWLKALVLAAALVPLGLLVWDAFTGALGANPVEAISRRTGRWALRLLLVTLALTPLRRLTGWNGAVRLRRLLGLLSFTYATVHFATYLVLDAAFDPAYILADVADRRFMTAGFATYLALLALAVTSTDAMQRRLGGRRWRRLHRLVYGAAAGAVIHFLWRFKTDYDRPLLYLVLAALLLALRLPPLARALAWPRNAFTGRRGAPVATRRPAQVVASAAAER